MPDYKEKARRVYDKLGTGSIADSERIENALREAHEAGRREGWRPIETAPRDGAHFLARQVVVADEYDEDNRLTRKDVREVYIVVAYWVFGGIAQFPWNGGIPSNVTYTHWMPLPPPPAILSEQGDV